MNLPIGWSDLNGSAGAWAMRILGWVLVAGAVTLGAPFWFDLLRRALAHRKGDLVRLVAALTGRPAASIMPSSGGSLPSNAGSTPA